MLRAHTLIFLAGSALALAGCDDPFDLDINEDPNAATRADAEAVMAFVQPNLISSRTIEYGGRGTTFWSQHWSGPAFGTSGEQYVISPNMTGNTWFGYYAEGLKSLLLMRQDAMAAEPALTNVAAQSDILSAYHFWILTSMWGEIPYTQALQFEEFPNPEFDEQETVLRGIVDDLDEALALIDVDEGGPPVTGSDFIYGGDMELWERFANSLKLRTLMMIRNRDPSVDTRIEALLDQPLIRDNLENAEFPYFDAAGQENQMWQVCFDFGGLTPNGCSFFIANRTLVELMNETGSGDPRLRTYFTPSPFIDTGGEIIGNFPGDAQQGDEALVKDNIIREDFPARILTASEVWFFEAEFLATQGNLGAAHAAYMTGVELAFDWWDGKPGEVPQAEEDEYLASLPASFTSEQQALEAIWTQQYIEVLERAPENWVQWKRTHFPDLLLPQGAIFSDIIRRLTIPSDELTSNPNAPEQVSPIDPMWFEPGN